MNLNDVKKAIMIIYNSGCGYTPNLIGQAGVGKTETVAQVAREHFADFKCVQIGQMVDSGDLMGLQYIEGGNARFTVPEWFPTKENTLLFFDEFNRASKDMQHAIFQMLSPEKVFNGRKLPKGCFVVTACNPPVDGYSVLDIGDEAMNDRLCHIKVTPTATEWVEYARKTGVDARMTEFINANVDALGIRPLEYDLANVAKPTPRAATHAAKILAELDKGNDNIIGELLGGIIGHVNALSLLKYIKTQYSPIDVNTVLTDYKKVSERVRAAAAATDARFDLLNKLISDIQTHYETTDLTPQTLDNLLLLMFDLPKGMAVQFVQRLVQCERVLQYIVKTDAKHEFWGERIGKHHGPVTDTKGNSNDK